ncbi:MAG TPA: copper resistance CopC family protein [Actinomycetota bacterium]|nr:copper resistance CopC family protein [Actinomycetota bacterium]
MMTPRSAVACLFACVQLASIAVLAVDASAHAAYESSDPPSDGTVSSPPPRVTVDFTEPVVDDSLLSITDPCGRQVDNRDSFVAADRITVTMSGEAAGRYTVAFDVVSAVDGHPTRGRFNFTSTGGSPCPDAAPAPDDPPEEEPEPDDPATGEGSRPSDGASTEAEPTAGPSGGSRRPQGNGGSRKILSEDRLVEETPTPVEDLADEAQSVPEQAPPVAEDDDLPLSGLFAAFAVAALIGAAGGYIYRGIVPPK